MNNILTKSEVTQNIMQAIENAVADIPDDKKEEAKAALLDALSAQMFSRPMGETE